MAQNAADIAFVEALTRGHIALPATFEQADRTLLAREFAGDGDPRSTGTDDAQINPKLSISRDCGDVDPDPPVPPLPDDPADAMAELKRRNAEDQ